LRANQRLVETMYTSRCGLVVRCWWETKMCPIYSVQVVEWFIRVAIQCNRRSIYIKRRIDLAEMLIWSFTNKHWAVSFAHQTRRVHTTSFLTPTLSPLPNHPPSHPRHLTKRSQGVQHSINEAFPRRTEQTGVQYQLNTRIL
jgi:hypothetical protein